MTLKGSRFIGIIMPCKVEEDIQANLAIVAKRYPNATHYCYAAIFGGSERKEKSSDNGEPSGTAGKPMLMTLRGSELSELMCIAVRYFGGTLLGTGGLVRAYTRAAQKAVRRAEILSYSICVDLTFSIDYSLYDKMMSVISRDGGKVIDTRFTDSVSLRVRAVSGTQDKLISDIELLTKGKSPAVSEEIYDIF